MKQKCLFSCAEPEKYKLIGTKVSRCRKTGLWKQKGGPPKCIERRKKKKKKTKKKPKKKQTKPKSIGHPIISSPRLVKFLFKFDPLLDIFSLFNCSVTPG